MNLLNRFWESLSPRLRKAVLVLAVVVGATFAATVAILVWSDGSLHARLGLVATKSDLADTQNALAAADSVKMQAMAEQAAAMKSEEILALLNTKEADARATILVPMLEELKGQRRDINTLFALVRDQGREVRALPAQMSRELEEVLESSRPPKSETELIRELLEKQQAQQDSILELLVKPRKKMKAPAM